MNIIQRINSPTPSFFKKLRNIGLMLAGISTAIASSPVVLPAAFVSIAGYAAVAGGVIGAVCQLATDTEQVINKLSYIYIKSTQSAIFDFHNIFKVALFQ